MRRGVVVKATTEHVVRKTRCPVHATKNYSSKIEYLIIAQARKKLNWVIMI